jgi:type I restriction enzyme, S subunit
MIERIIKSFEVWMDAQGVKSKGRIKSIDNISLEGIARLRVLILELAIRGNLVTQDSSDEPASVLVKKSTEEKDRFIENGRIKKHKKLVDIEKDNMPFSLPYGWQWSWFTQVYFFQEGPGIRNWQFRSQGIKLLNVQNIVNNKLILENTDKYIDEKEYEDKYLHFTIEENDLLFASSGGSGFVN